MNACPQQLDPGLITDFHAPARKQRNASAQVRQLGALAEIHLGARRAKLIVKRMNRRIALLADVAELRLDRFPELKLVIAHFGGGIAAIKERIAAKAYRFGTPLKRSFDDYFDLLYFDMSGFEGGPNALRCALTGIKPERLVFATDYPQDFTGATTDTRKGAGDIRKYIQEIRALPLPEEIKAKMLGETAAELLGLSR